MLLPLPLRERVGVRGPAARCLGLVIKHLTRSPTGCRAYPPRRQDPEHRQEAMDRLVITLWRPVGRRELQLIANADMHTLPHPPARAADFLPRAHRNIRNKDSTRSERTTR